MRKTFSVGKYDVDLSTSAKRSWLELRQFKTDAGYHWVWGRLSLTIEDGTAEVVPTCAACGDLEVGEVSAGDEGLTLCQGCNGVEQGYVYVSLREAGL